MRKNFFIVATPIGNLEDISFRAIRILQEVDIILCEDTRVTKKLLQHYDIQTPTESYHAQASLTKEDSIIERMDNGVTFALVSDAGTPTISDPGVKIIQRIYEEFEGTVSIQSIPGASALITALTTTGFTGNQFTFFGFVPHKKGRSTLFEQIKNTEHISVFYESPHRIMRTLKDLAERFDIHRHIAVCRELTKLYEEIVRGSAEEVYAFFIDNPEKIKGEFVVVVDKK
ncbi:MAG: 16S rRNA (cytidine(1402)-2'-O)-methyltransferase [Candidatus Pacebacteria bacterium]|nr:16S rRNA (cytidine(1402)-2'-O)-methyltransferase [Candidatus Paceibacterota bacterium]